MFVCIFSIGNGSWATFGVTTDVIKTFGNLTTVQCSSAHLTSFAVLVDVTGGLRVSSMINYHTYGGPIPMQGLSIGPSQQLFYQV